ncbi:RNA 2',3'-cyclic phosphodiesterase [Candidatus Mycalebacterium sp.]
MLNLRADGNTVRLFISLAAPEKIRKTVKSRTSAIRSLRGVKWESEEKFHITLRFLGETRVDTIPEIRSALKGCCGSFSPIVIKTDGVSAITRRRYPETLAVMAQSDDTLYDLKDAIDSELETLGFEPEKRDFLPHITIGWVKKKMKLPELPQFELDFVAERVCLMESELRREGARHMELEGFRLG